MYSALPFVARCTLSCRYKVAELAAAHLLLRVSPPDRLDGPPMYKCGISFDVALALGRDMRVPILDLIWETS
jgi:origin recognition complex subunit 5